MRVDGETTAFLFASLVPRTSGSNCLLLLAACVHARTAFCIKPLAVDVLVCVSETKMSKPLNVYIMNIKAAAVSLKELV